MPFWGSRDEAVDDFDGFDPTPYSGGYDLSLTYGRPLDPSDEICYPLSATGDVDLERPHYSSGSQTSSFETKPQPAYTFEPQPQPVSNTGYPGYDHPSYGHGGVPGASDYGSNYGGRPQFQDYGSAYGQGYGDRPQPQEYGSGYESGRKPQYGSGYGQQEGSFGYGREETKHYGEEGYRVSGYGRSQEEGYGRQGYGGNEYGRSEEDIGGGDGGYKKSNDYPYGGNTTYNRPSYGEEEEETGRYKTSGRFGEEGEYKKSSYGDEYRDTEYEKPSYYRGEEGEGYGHSKYGKDSDDDDDDDEKKKHSYQKHHHRHNWDD